MSPGLSPDAGSEPMAAEGIAAEVARPTAPAENAPASAEAPATPSPERSVGTASPHVTDVALAPALCNAPEDQQSPCTCAVQPSMAPDALTATASMGEAAAARVSDVCEYHTDASPSRASQAASLAQQPGQDGSDDAPEEGSTFSGRSLNAVHGGADAEDAASLASFCAGSDADKVRSCHEVLTIALCGIVVWWHMRVGSR